MVHTSEMFVTAYKKICHHNLADHNPHFHPCENLEFPVIYLVGKVNKSFLGWKQPSDWFHYFQWQDDSKNEGMHRRLKDMIYFQWQLSMIVGLHIPSLKV
jgi:hypothetical protein